MIYKREVHRSDLKKGGKSGKVLVPKVCGICGWLGPNNHWLRHWRTHHPGKKAKELPRSDEPS